MRSAKVLDAGHQVLCTGMKSKLHRCLAQADQRSEFRANVGLDKARGGYELYEKLKKLNLNIKGFFAFLCHTAVRLV